jgi:hypothetical protein
LIVSEESLRLAYRQFNEALRNAGDGAILLSDWEDSQLSAYRLGSSFEIARQEVVFSIFPDLAESLEGVIKEDGEEPESDDVEGRCRPHMESHKVTSKPILHREGVL